jgi:hypothetical protein
MTNCDQPLIIHHGTDHAECPDLDCTAEPDRHGTTLPCRWSWLYAHGRKVGGQPFPDVRCPGCYHIRRAGTPDTPIEATN